jgi:pimeloyl-ACP methyl ester carboxylesterase
VDTSLIQKITIRPFYLTLLILFYALFVASVPVQSVKSKATFSLEKIALGGFKQTILITGKDNSKPILLFVHGGPGFSEMALLRKYNSDLDNHYLVVNWDQRGTNLSYEPSMPKKSMTAEQIIKDGHELVQYLKKRYHRKKIFLAGHSWGTYVATMMASRHPEDFYAYIGIGQVVNMMENDRLSFKYALDSARKDRNKKAVAELTPLISRYPARPAVLQDLYTSRKWMDYYGGEVAGQHGATIIFEGVSDGKNPLYNVKNALDGTDLSMQCLWSGFLATDLERTVPQLNIPVYFILGKHDYNAPYMLAIHYLKVLKAPAKKMFMFENSAHLPPFEEPAKFNRIMADIAKTAGT